MIKVIDNVLPSNILSEIQNLITSDNFPWFLNKEIITEKKYEHSLLETHQFVHILFNLEVAPNIRSTHYNYFLNIVKSLCIKYQINGNLFRLKLNCLSNHFKSNNNTINPPHTDYSENHTSFILYINDSDGDTIFFEKFKEIKRVSPKANRLCIFKGGIPHCSTNPKYNEHRFVLNTVITHK